MQINSLQSLIRILWGSRMIPSFYVLGNWVSQEVLLIYALQASKWGAGFWTQVSLMSEPDILNQIMDCFNLRSLKLGILICSTGKCVSNSWDLWEDCIRQHMKSTQHTSFWTIRVGNLRQDLEVMSMKMQTLQPCEVLWGFYWHISVCSLSVGPPVALRFPEVNTKEDIWIFLWCALSCAFVLREACLALVGDQGYFSQRLLFSLMFNHAIKPRTQWCLCTAKADNPRSPLGEHGSLLTWQSRLASECNYS